MRLYYNQLAAQLKQGLAPVYLLVGDEPLQLQEAGDAIKKAAARAGFSERETYLADKSFQWHELQNSAGNMSLFATQRIIDLHIPTGKPGTKGSSSIVSFIENIPSDVMLIIRCDEWNVANEKTKWVKTVVDKGAFLRVYQPKAAELPQWIRKRCQSIGLQVDNDAIGLLSMRLEGNLLAAAQELEKLKMRFPNQTITGRDIMGLVADSARFDVFRLTDSLLEKKPARAIRILRSLKKNDISPVVIHWALERETRMLSELSFIRQQNRNVSAADYRKLGVWQNRQAIIQSTLNQYGLSHWEFCLSQLSKIDRMIKGRLTGDPWLAIEKWLMSFMR
ncbi:DNA polymerase III subunit delta [Marinicella litoralis]|uniref:DNA polymerase III subunit delta n=1 Tax=Marinicella litoralis TaxID=644220 RepID=A0A4R6XI92_9GAMM|nr:DNA polymerase III subunit delta [Marinicella litoralis]TDR16873.1 DNA polymerase III delta subunit [Marinicella litoralis]